jgi:hypothetical protein
MVEKRAHPPIEELLQNISNLRVIVYRNLNVQGILSRKYNFKNYQLILYYSNFPSYFKAEKENKRRKTIIKIVIKKGQGKG